MSVSLRKPVPPHFGHCGARGQEVLGVARVPLVRPVPVAHDVGHVLDQPLLHEQRGARRAVEGHDRHAPDALARDDPFGAVRDHVEDALLAPVRDPVDLVPDGVERALAQAVLVQRDEPLLGGAEERRVLAAPAMRIRVDQRDGRHERAGPLEVLDDLRVGVPDRETGEVRHLRDEAPVIVDGIVDRQADLLAQLVVLFAVPRGDVDEPRARVHRDPVGRHHGRVAIDEGMATDGAGEIGPRHLERGRRAPRPRTPGSSRNAGASARATTSASPSTSTAV